MSVTDPAALLGGLEPHDQIAATVDERTLEILERRRRTAVVKRRGWLVRRLLLAADVVGLLGALLLAEWIAARGSDAGVLDARVEILVFLATFPAWVVVAKLYSLYDRDEERTDHSTADDVVRVFNMVTVCTWLSWVVTYLTGVAHPGPSKLVIFWAGAIAFVSFARAGARALGRRHVAYLQNTVIVGAGRVGQLIAKKFLDHPEYGINLVGFVDSSPMERRDDLQHLVLLGGPDQLPELVLRYDIERVVVAFSNERHDTTLELVRELRHLGVQVDMVPRLFESLAPHVMIHPIEGIPLVGLPPVRLAPSSLLLKRAVDVAVSASALIALLPAMALVAAAVYLDSGRPIFYRRRVLGRGGREIDAFKFRTMRTELCVGDRYGGERADRALQDLLADPAQGRAYALRHKLDEDPRVTRVGQILRRTSLDELPQLVNVLIGQMSIVGPRMITADELERYGREAATLLSTRPGLTGYWQINGRSSVDYRDRVRLDLAYIGGWSMSLDFNIMLRTMRVLLTGRGAH